MKVFLCHQSESKPFVRALADELAKVGLASWVDEAEIGPGESLVKRIGEGIHEECDALIASVGRLALDSSWVQEELGQGKYAEITRSGFQLIVILLDDVAPDDLPEYLHDKKHVLWEKERPSDPGQLHPGYGQIITQLFKHSGGLQPDEAAEDVSRLLDRFLTLLYAYGSQRQVTKRTGFGDLMAFGEIRRDFSFSAIHAWNKYSAMPDGPLVNTGRDFVASIINVDVALKDWAMGYADTNFQEAVTGDFLEILQKTEATIDISEMADTVRRRIDLHGDSSMSSLYHLEQTQPKSRLDWAVDVGGQSHRFGLWDPSAPPDETAERWRSVVDAAERDAYRAWRSGEWPYPST